MGWQVTATTVLCDQVNDFTVIMVYPDKTAKCSFLETHFNTRNAHKKLKNCKRPDCPLMAEFTERAFRM